MARIKGWKKVVDGKNHLEYTHKSPRSYYGDIRLVIERLPIGESSVTTGQDYLYYVRTYDSRGYLHDSISYGTFDDAKQYALEYMRRHPNG